MCFALNSRLFCLNFNLFFKNSRKWQCICISPKTQIFSQKSSEKLDFLASPLSCIAPELGRKEKSVLGIWNIDKDIEFHNLHECESIVTMQRVEEYF